MGYDLSNSRRWIVPHGGEPREVLRVKDAAGVILWEKYYRVSYEANSDGMQYWVVYLNANGGSGSMSPLHVPKGSSVSLPACAFSRAGYALKTQQYNTAADGSGASYSAGGSLTPSANMTLYAQWQANSYAISFNSNGGSGSMSPVTAAYGSAVTLPACAFTRSGHVFSMWKYTIGGEESYFEDQDRFVMPAQNLSLTAQWTQTTGQYALVLAASPAAGGTVTGGGTFDYGTSRTVTATPAAGYSFESWSDGGAQSHVVTVTSDMLLTATFAAQNYTVTFHRDMTNGNVTSITADAGTSIADQVNNLVGQISANGALIRGWQFDQWNVDSEDEDPYAPIQQSFDVYPIYKIRSGWNVGGEIPSDSSGTGSYEVGIAPTLSERAMPQGFYVAGDVTGHYRHNASPENHKIAMGVYIESQNGAVTRLTNNPTVVDSGEAHSIQPFSVELDKYQPIGQDAVSMYFEASKVKPPICAVKWEVSAVAHLYLYPNI